MVFNPRIDGLVKLDQHLKTVASLFYLRFELVKHLLKTLVSLLVFLVSRATVAFHTPLFITEMDVKVVLQKI